MKRKPCWSRSIQWYHFQAIQISCPCPFKAACNGVFVWRITVRLKTAWKPNTRSVWLCQNLRVKNCNCKLAEISANWHFCSGRKQYLRKKLQRKYFPAEVDVAWSGENYNFTLSYHWYGFIQTILKGEVNVGLRNINPLTRGIGLVCPSKVWRPIT